MLMRKNTCPVDYRMCKQTVTVYHKDGSWYADKVERAAELGLMVGLSDDEFGVGQPVTREQLATVVVGLYEKLSK